MTPEEATELLEPRVAIDAARADYRAVLATALLDVKNKIHQADDLLVAVQSAVARLSAREVELGREIEHVDELLPSFRDRMIAERVAAETNGHCNGDTGAEGDPPAESTEIPCPHCDRTFQNHAGLLIHVGRAHKPTVDEIVVVEQVSQDQRGYHCTDCPVGFVRVNDLKAHTREEHGRGATPAERQERRVPVDQRVAVA